MSRFDTAKQDSDLTQALQRLKRQAIVVALVQIAGALALANLLSTFWPQPVVMRWALVTMVAFLHIWSLTWRQLSSHRSADGTAYLPALGPGNLLSLFRAWLLACLAGFVLTPWPPGIWAWLPALLVTLATLSGTFAGYVSRVSGYASALGDFLDAELDALGILIVVSVAIRLGHLPLWFLLIGLARYVFTTALSWRQRLHHPCRPLSPSVMRRMLAGMLMGFLTVTLWPIVNLQVMTLAGAVFAVPFLVIFLRDWLVVSTRLDVSSPTYERWQARAQNVFMGWLPLGLRLIGGLALVAVLWQGMTQFTESVAAFSDFGYPAATGLLALFLLMEVVALPLLVLGVAGRWVALLLILPVGFTALTSAAAPEHLVVLLACVYGLIFGSGWRSRWQPEDAWFRLWAEES